MGKQGAVARGAHKVKLVAVVERRKQPLRGAATEVRKHALVVLSEIQERDSKQGAWGGEGRRHCVLRQRARRQLRIALQEQALLPDRK
jgi:hypothetical protein